MSAVVLVLLAFLSVGSLGGDHVGPQIGTGVVYFLDQPGDRTWGNVDWIASFNCGCENDTIGGSWDKDCNEMKIYECFSPDCNDCIEYDEWHTGLDCFADDIHCFYTEDAPPDTVSPVNEGWFSIVDYIDENCPTTGLLLSRSFRVEQCIFVPSLAFEEDLWAECNATGEDALEIFISYDGSCDTLQGGVDSLECTNYSWFPREFSGCGTFSAPPDDAPLPPQHFPGSGDGEGDGEDKFPIVEVVAPIAAVGLCFAMLVLCFCICLIILVIIAVLLLLGGVGSGSVSNNTMFSSSLMSGRLFTSDAKRQDSTDEEEMDVFAKKSKQFTTTLTAGHMVVPYEDLNIINPPIGQGAFGVVNRAMYNETQVAVKTLVVDAYESNVEEFMKEVECLAQLHHPNIVLFIGACNDPPAIITEFVARGSLYDIIHCEPASLTTSRSLTLTIGIAQGMAYLHKQTPPMIHRDLKSANILVTKGYDAKICDFGISKRDESTNNMTKRAGTTRWTAPEVLDGPDRYTSKADVYSYAIILWEIFAKDLPFADLRFDHEIEDAVLDGIRPELPSKLPKGLTRIIDDCWEKDPEDRPTFISICKALKRVQFDRTSSMDLKRKLKKKKKGGQKNIESSEITSGNSEESSSEGSSASDDSGSTESTESSESSERETASSDGSSYSSSSR